MVGISLPIFMNRLVTNLRLLLAAWFLSAGLLAAQLAEARG